jgi:hypothetical protein
MKSGGACANVTELCGLDFSQLLSTVPRDSFSASVYRGKSGKSVKLTTHLQIMARLRSAGPRVHSPMSPHATALSYLIK